MKPVFTPHYTSSAVYRRDGCMRFCIKCAIYALVRSLGPSPHPGIRTSGGHAGAKRTPDY